MKKALILVYAMLGIVMIAVTPSLAAYVDVNVDGKAMPWLNSANPSYSYGIANGSGPTTVTSTSGISFADGNMITIQWLSGTTRAGSSFGSYDANGNITYKTKYYSGGWVDAPGSTGKYFPTKYVANPSVITVSYYLMALVGSFANTSGVIVDQPFFIGNGPLSIVVPTGATQLQLGLNDDNFSDNTGSFTIRVSGAAVPIPPSVWLLGAGLAGIAGVRRKFRR